MKDWTRAVFLGQTGSFVHVLIIPNQIKENVRLMLEGGWMAQQTLKQKSVCFLFPVTKGSPLTVKDRSINKMIQLH